MDKDPQSCKETASGSKSGPNTGPVPTIAEKKKLKKAYGNLFEQVSRLLFEDDPIGINFVGNKDEYDTETSTILPRLKKCNSTEDVNIVVHEEFCRWFNEDMAGPKKRYSKVSREIWNMWALSDLR